MKRISGISASQGYALGKVLKLVDVVIDFGNLAKKTPENLAKEKQKFSQSLEKVLLDIDNLIAKNKHKLSEEELQVFQAHKEIATDPAVKDMIFTKIDHENKNATIATKETFDFFAETFLSMQDNQYFQERAADVLDVSKRLIYALENVNKPDLSLIDEEVILVAKDLTPSETVQLDKQFVKCFLTEIGGKTSHSAIMARSMEIPAIVGIKNLLSELEDGDLVAVDANQGLVFVDPDQEIQSQILDKQKNFLAEKKDLENFLYKESQTKDGLKVEIAANIGNVLDAKQAKKYNADAIGLFRSEFLYMDAQEWPSEDLQFENYKKVLLSLQNKKVVVRTLDIGGDKTLNYFKFDHELNPFLGYRAIRFSLDKQSIFKTQLRALIRASKFGKIAIMFPMIATVEEFKKAKYIFDKCYEQLKNENYPIAPKNEIEIGMMMEIPSAAILADVFAKYCDFFSIGTNDLMQYTMAADRMSQKISYLYQPLNPSILKMIKNVIDGAKTNLNKKVWVGMCGEMAGDPEAIPVLLGLGLDEFSVSAASILATKKLISKLDYQQCKKLAKDCLTLENEKEVKEKIQFFLNNLI